MKLTDEKVRTITGMGYKLVKSDERSFKFTGDFIIYDSCIGKKSVIVSDDYSDSWISYKYAVSNNDTILNLQAALGFVKRDEKIIKDILNNENAE